MKRKLLALTLALSMCSFPVYAEDAATVESVLQGMQEYSAGVNSTAATMTMNMDAALKISSDEAPETSIPVTLSGDFDMKFLQDPMQIAATTSLKIAAMGQSEDMNMEMYMTVSEDGSSMDSYAKVIAEGEDSGWQHSAVDMEEMLNALNISSIDELKSMQTDKLNGILPIDYTLTEADDAYHLEGILSFSDMMPFIEASMSAQGLDMADEEMALVESMLGGFKMDMNYVIDKETYAAKTCHVDFNDSDLSVFNSMLSQMVGGLFSSEDGSSSANVSFVLNDLSMDMDFAYDTVDSIEIPEEALSAELIDINELVTEAAEIAE